MTEPLPGDLWPDIRPDAARRLMAAAVDAFAARGYHATTTRDIATAAGMSPAALYVHFPSKAAVLFAISRSGHERALAMVEAAFAGPGSPTERMGALVAEFVSWHATKHRIARIVQYELSALSAADYAVVASLRRKTEAVVRALIDEGVRAGVFRVADVRIAARAILSLAIDVARWYTPDFRPAPAELGKRYAELALTMLGAS
ncbi:TetR/AcrR family transcriptional regulator [Actinokineospora iranica]|uniref:DNA-binding transcriptional regulator, AcrR family n=1 Tax=Actinokineospora iranica TaxID=1271860 RepID=A0A1G6J118_9PSEU|nr:TetR/AcrR family transcriptional regulator [Actinokineospora iranica]SDC12542.1 DNA-binding transcriptional regulator, AcrR family [Actinokineospora iranica]